jgi:hypothetical protein
MQVGAQVGFGNAKSFVLIAAQGEHFKRPIGNSSIPLTIHPHWTVSSGPMAATSVFHAAAGRSNTVRSNIAKYCFGKLMLNHCHVRPLDNQS